MEQGLVYQQRDRAQITGRVGEVFTFYLARNDPVELDEFIAAVNFLRCGVTLVQFIWDAGCTCGPNIGRDRSQLETWIKSVVQEGEKFQVECPSDGIATSPLVVITLTRLV